MSFPPNNSVSPLPPPTIGKIGPYTVFVTPPLANYTPVVRNPPPVVQTPPPVVQTPPQQWKNETQSEGEAWGGITNAIKKIKKAHSSLDEHVAHWFGLNQSKYQWALDDYYETKGGDQLEATAAKDISSKAQTI